MPRVATQEYCGSKTMKEGCSWLIVSVRDKDRSKLPHRKKQNLELQKKWKIKQRAENTEYAKRQRVCKALYSKTENGRKKSKEANKRNIQTKIICNRRRALKKQGVTGKHTRNEWEQLKKKHNNKCLICGISENDISIKWAGTQFTKLTKDHIKPLSKGGTDNIDNIQPLCVSCNAKKRDKFYE